MVDFNIKVDNIRCGGCSNTISKKLLEHPDINTAAVDVEAQTVSINAVDANAEKTAIDILKSLGYPLQGSSEGIEALGDKAKSVISCATGKLS